MKVLIDIAKDYYNKIKGIKVSHYTARVYVAVKNGVVIPDDATNGDMLMALFPNVFVTNCKLVDKVGYFNFDEYWWNAPYNGGNENE